MSNKLIYNMNNYSKTKGFSLIELMMVVAIIAILASIAFPSYTRYMVRAKRADAQQRLLSLSQGMERFFLANNSYKGAAAAGADTGTPTVGPSQSPESGTAIYNFTISAADATSYTVLATPVGGQASDGKLKITSDGLKSWDRNNDGDYADTDENNWINK